MADDGKYPLVVGLTFLFNLLLGTGVLTMPAVFGAAGWVSACLVVTLLCAMSYKEACNLVESMANANFVKRTRLNTHAPAHRKDNADEFESSALLSYSSDLEELDDDEVLVVQPLSEPTTSVLSSEPNCSAVRSAAKSQANLKSQLQKQQSTESALSLLTAAMDNMSSVIGSVSAVNPSVNTTNGSDGGGNGLDTDSNEDFDNQVIVLNKSDSHSHSSHYGMAHSQSQATLRERLKPIRRYFEIDDKYELGDMCELFLGSIWVRFFFASIIIYLLGDLMIYNTMLAKSTREVACTAKLNCSDPNPLDAACWTGVTITRRNMYRIFLMVFVLILLPLTYAELKKTSSIQIVTIILRWLAFISMVGVTIKIFVKGEATGRPKMFDIANVPKMFGICVYAFMCHHSVPSILTPVRHKGNLNRGLTLDYMLVFGLYLLVSITAVFAFENVADVYTLNFQVNDCPAHGASNNTENPGNVPVLDYFLPTYPIFTLFSSYTMIALTLINNMKVLARNWCDITKPLLHYTFPLMAMIPPLLVALFTEDVSSVVSYVGSYAGGLIQYVFPSILVYRSRQQTKARLATFVREKYPDLDLSTLSNDELYTAVNPHASPFQHNIYLLITAAWWVICVGLVTLDHILSFVHHKS